MNIEQIEVTLAGPALDYDAFTRAEMDAAFTRVQNPTNWKLGNKVWIADEALEVTRAAVGFFAGSDLKVLWTNGAGKSFVAFAGYYADVGA